jgi:hypothetical protein
MGTPVGVTRHPGGRVPPRACTSALPVHRKLLRVCCRDLRLQLTFGGVVDRVTAAHQQRRDVRGIDHVFGWRSPSTGAWWIASYGGLVHGGVVDMRDRCTSSGSTGFR